MEHADARYLQSKRTVDARARSRRVRDRLLAALPPEPTIVELGAGTGSLVPTLLDWGICEGTYRGVDRSADVLDYARRTLPRELAAAYPVTETDAGFVVSDLDVRFVNGDVCERVASDADLVVAQAVLDVVPFVEAMNVVERTLRPGGLAYLPITFDGVSLFTPDHPADERVEKAYHAHIDAQPGRDSRTGRHLLTHLAERDGDLLAAAASDWIVRPRDGAYPADERYFLGRILDFVASALDERDFDERELDPDDANEWLTTRREQLAEAQLTYVAHQYDFLYRASSS